MKFRFTFSLRDAVDASRILYNLGYITYETLTDVFILEFAEEEDLEELCLELEGYEIEYDYQELEYEFEEEV